MALDVRQRWSRTRAAGRMVLALMLAAGWAAMLLSATQARAQVAREAGIALQRGNTEQAVQLYTQALADQTLPAERRAALLSDRGVARTRLNQLQGAIEDFNRSVELLPENASVYNNRGTVLIALGLDREALRDFERAVVLSPGYAAAYANRAMARVKLGENETAFRDYAQAARLAPQSPAPLSGRGRLHLAQNRPHAALRDFGRAIVIDGRFGPAYRGRADARLALERFEEAVEDLSRATAFDPTNAQIYLTRGYAYLAAKNTAAAVKDFTRAAEINPRSSAALEGRALADAKVEAYDGALNDLAKALEIDPRSAQAYAYRALVYKMMNQPELGAKDLERALKLDAERPEVLWAKGELAIATGSTDEGIADLRRAVTAKPMLRDAAATLQRLGATQTGEAPVPGAGLEPWEVQTTLGRFEARNPEFSRLVVPLEMMGAGQPKLLEWELKKAPLKGIGVLRFKAGQVTGKDGVEEIEYAAIVDVLAATVIGVDIVRQGSRMAAWSWDDAQVAVTGLDGGTETYVLRTKRENVAEQPQRRYEGERRAVSGTPDWAPWAQRGQGGGGGDGRRQRSQPKSLFDMLFN